MVVQFQNIILAVRAYTVFGINKIWCHRKLRPGNSWSLNVQHWNLAPSSFSRFLFDFFMSVLAKLHRLSTQLIHKIDLDIPAVTYCIFPAIP